MNDSTQQALLNRLDALAQKLGVASQFLFQLYVRQAYIDGIECAVAIVLLAVSALYMGRLAKRRLDDDDSDGWGVLLAIGVAVCAIAAFMTLVNGFDLWMNPQLCAFKQIASTLK